MMRRIHMIEVARAAQREKNSLRTLPVTSVNGEVIEPVDTRVFQKSLKKTLKSGVDKRR